MYKETLKRTQEIRDAGYKVKEVWACQVQKTEEHLPQKQMHSYPHLILYNFEWYGHKNLRKNPTGTFTIENAHVPLSVSMGDTLNREPTHICEKDPAVLVYKFMKDLERRGANTQKKVLQTWMPEDKETLQREACKRIEEWCNEVPVLGFNSGQYDLNLIREHFAKCLADTTDKVRVAKNANRIMFILTHSFRFLDIMNYLGPGTSYYKWVKVYGCQTVKSWFPYEWFDNPEKLDFPGLPEYDAWYSKLKGGHVLSREEWQGCKRTFAENGMQTFADWLRYYNNLDVAPGLEALEKMRAFYTENGDRHLERRGEHSRGQLALPSPRSRGKRRRTLESQQRGLRDVERRSERWAHQIPRRGVTSLRPHQQAHPKLCKRILGYNANALYLSTMLRDMPCGQEKISTHFTPRRLVDNLKNGTWFGFAEVDIEVPEKL